MGCCKSFEGFGEVEVKMGDFPTQTGGIADATDEDFGEISLNSPADYKNAATSESRLGESIIYYTRSSSFYVNRSDIESAFLQSLSQVRRSTLNSLKNHDFPSINEE